MRESGGSGTPSGEKFEGKGTSEEESGKTREEQGTGGDGVFGGGHGDITSFVKKIMKQRMDDTVRCGDLRGTSGKT